ncbi:hypothetical protein [Microbacterium sp. K24]|uniref:hypothetical protein n=1 Tax=Microbacterium sp. K24 TaxID=2305446 RepID=UPI00109CC788|nr:hypothetical protein [Microbacterium sp. K24]
MTTEELIALCERAVVPVSEWRNRDTARSQERIGTAWALLKAGCEWVASSDPRTDDDTIWVEIRFPGFNAWEYGRDDRDNWEDELFYIPTAARLDASAGGDWY